MGRTKQTARRTITPRANKFDLHKQSYWNGNGTHQQLSDRCFDEMQRRNTNFERITTDNGNWALFNGMAGIYYAKFNDGDGLRGAIDNNRVHGFSSLEEFQEHACDVDAPASVQSYLRTGGRDAALEHAMDDVIEWVAKEEGVTLEDKDFDSQKAESEEKSKD